MASDGDHTRQAFDRYAATKPNHPMWQDGLQEGVWAAAIVVLGSLVVLRWFRGLALLSSLWIWLGIVLVAGAIGIGVNLGIGRLKATRTAKDEIRRRAEQERETERKIHQAKILGQFDRFGGKE